MLTDPWSGSRDKKTHRNLSPYRDIKEISRYTSRGQSVVGTQRGEGNLSLPATSKIKSLLYKVYKERNPFKGLRKEKLPAWVGLNFDLLLFVYIPGGGDSHRTAVSGGGSGGIDSIIADNSPKIQLSQKTACLPEVENLTRSVDFIRTLLKWELVNNKIPFEDKELVEILKRFEDGKKKLAKCEVRLTKLPYCSKHGHLRLEWRKEDLELVREEWDINSSLVKKAKLKYHPHRCHSRICPVCGYFDRREHYGELLDLLERSLEDINSQLAFATFTFKGFLTPLTGVEYAFNIRSKVYNLSLSRKFLKVLKPYVIKEVFEFGRRLRREKINKKYPDYWRKRLKTHIKHIREFMQWFIPALEEKLKEQKKVRIKDLFNLILKFEIHKTEKGFWHPHFHTIIDRFIPKLVLNAFWKYITNGRGEITDIRRLRGKKAVEEVNKYITKPVNSKITDLTKGVKNGITTSNGAKLSYEEILLLEFSLYQRQTYAVWGFWEKWRKVLNETRKKHNKEEKRSLHLYKVSVLMNQSMFHIPKAIRFAMKSASYVDVGKGEIHLGEIFVKTSIGYEMDLEDLQSLIEKTPYLKPKVNVYASPDGDIELKPVLNGEDLEAFYSVLVKAIKDHKEFRKFFNLPERIEIDTSLYEENDEIPETLLEDMEMNGLGFDLDI